MWGQLANCAIGVWLMASPSLLGYGNPARTNDWIIGPLVATVACVALWEATREVRWANVPLGAWLIVSPFLLSYPTVPLIHGLAVGLLVVMLSLVRGRTRKSFGGGWASLWDTTVLARGDSG